MTLSKSTTAMLESYGRSFLGAALALYMTGSTDWQDYVYALVAAFAPVAIRYFNKNDISFGRINGSSTPDVVAQEAVKAVEKIVKAKPVAKVPAAKKAPAKKAPAKKPASK